VEMLKTFCTEMEGDYFVFVPPTAEALLPILSTSDEMTMLCDRRTARPSTPGLS